MERHISSGPPGSRHASSLPLPGPVGATTATFWPRNASVAVAPGVELRATPPCIAFGALISVQPLLRWNWPSSRRTKVIGQLFDQALQLPASSRPRTRCCCSAYSGASLTAGVPVVVATVCHGPQVPLVYVRRWTWKSSAVDFVLLSLANHDTLTGALPM